MRQESILQSGDLSCALLVKHFHHLLIGQFALFIQYRRPFDSIMGYLSFLRQIPHVLRERRRILSLSRLSVQEIDQLLDRSPDGVSLPRWILCRLGAQDI